MKTQKFILAAAVASLLLAGITGCQSSGSSSADPPGPDTAAVVLSGKKTFDIIGRTGTPITYSKPEGPEAEVISQAVRSRLEDIGYQSRPDSPEFVVSVAWDEYQKLVQPSPADTQATSQSAPVVAEDQATLAITVRDKYSGTVLWTSPVSEPVDPHMVTDNQARALVAKALTDFPPAQTSK